MGLRSNGLRQQVYEDWLIRLGEELRVLGGGVRANVRAIAERNTARPGNGVIIRIQGRLWIQAASTDTVGAVRIGPPRVNASKNSVNIIYDFQTFNESLAYTNAV